MVIHLTPEREAQLSEYARRHGQDPTAALDEVLASALESDRQDSHEAMVGIQQGFEDWEAGQTRLLNESLGALRKKHGVPG